MIGYSTETPQTLVESRGKTQFRYNVQDYERADEMTDVVITEKQFEYVWIEGEVTRKKIIDALIRAKYDMNDEFNLVAKDHDSADYIAYRDYVDECKVIADSVLVPTMENTKAEIEAYMDANGIEFNGGDTKADLLQKIEWDSK